MNIIVPSTALRAKPDETHSLETECLFGEEVETFEQTDNWVRIKLLIDDYTGWIKKSSLGILKKPTHRVLLKRSFILSSNDTKSNCLHYLPLGAKLCVKCIKDKWAEVYLSNKHKMSIGYIPSGHIVSLDSKVLDWVSTAEQLIDTPYKWGGRDSLGIDCSALLQLSYETYGENLPRNTNDQVNLNKPVISNLDELKRGVVIFWKGHVAIMIDKKNCIHANAFHMKTSIEPLEIINNRMDQNNRITKILNFNLN